MQSSTTPFIQPATTAQPHQAAELTWVERFKNWETWPWLMKYIPILPVWLYYSIRARSFCFFTASNPTLTFGGFDGQNKQEMYNQLPEQLKPKSFFTPAGLPFELIESVFGNHFQFPVAVKPNVGRMGLLFRKIDSMEELRQYHTNIRVDYILQEFIDCPVEVSVFYYRFPGAQRGTITGFVQKEYLEVIGDGHSTLAELIDQYDRVKFRKHEFFAKHSLRLQNILPNGKRYQLSHALNLSRGGKLVSLERQKDDKLLSVFDDLSHRTGFQFGRYDIKCNSISELKEGKFVILEFNGCGAEPHHVYGNNNSYFKALRILVDHWKVLYQISVANHKRGVAYWKLGKGLIEMLKTRVQIQYLKLADRALVN